MEYKESDDVLHDFIEKAGSPELAVARCFMALSNCYRHLALKFPEQELEKFFEDDNINKTFVDWVGIFNDLAFKEIAYKEQYQVEE